MKIVISPKDGGILWGRTQTQTDLESQQSNYISRFHLPLKQSTPLFGGHLWQAAHGHHDFDTPSDDWASLEAPG